MIKGAKGEGKEARQLKQIKDIKRMERWFRKRGPVIEGLIIAVKVVGLIVYAPFWILGKTIAVIAKCSPLPFE